MFIYDIDFMFSSYPICDRSFYSWLKFHTDREILYYRIGAPKPFYPTDFLKFNVFLMDDFKEIEDEINSIKSENKLSKVVLYILCNEINNRVIVQKLLSISKSKIDVITISDKNDNLRKEDFEDILYRLKRERFPFSKLSLELFVKNNIESEIENRINIDLNDIIQFALSYGLIIFDFSERDSIFPKIDHKRYYKSLSIYIDNKAQQYIKYLKDY